MEYKAYKIWRFAYHSHEDTVYLPEGTKMYCVYKHRDEANAVQPKDLNGKNAWYENWIAIFPYSEDIEKMSHSMGWSYTDGNVTVKDDYTVRQTFNLHYYNVNNKYIVWELQDIFPLDENWPETDECPQFPEPEYVKIRAHNVKFDSKEFVEGYKIADTLPEDEREEYLKDRFAPVAQYVKIHGISRGRFDCTTITTGSWATEDVLHNIERNDYEFGKIICDDHYLRTEPCTKEKYEEILNKEINYIYGCDK